MLFLRPELKQVIHCAGVENPLNVEAVKSEIQASVLPKHPKFCSLLVQDRHGVGEVTNDLKAVPTILQLRRGDWRKTTTMAAWAAVVGLVGVLWYGLMFALQFAARLLWVRDRKTAILGGDGVEHWPRKIATARFCIEDMRIAKRARALREGLRITGLAMVNLRKQPGLQWYHRDGADPLQQVRRVKVYLELKKQCMEAHLTNKVCIYLTSYFGPKVLCNTSFTISNIVGPQEDVAIGTDTAHGKLYAGRADMQILVAKDIIPDHEFLAQCFEDALIEMKEAALATIKNC